MKILELIDVHTYYAEGHILNGVSLQVEEGSAIALLGRNGAGKTTTIHSIIGFTPPAAGAIYFRQKEISRLSSYQICQAGIALVPQGRRIFPSLSVKENLMIGARRTVGGGAWSLEKVYSAFPHLRQRANHKGDLLSGGEQQMVCIGRALLTNPSLILMDEPSEGLAPIIIREMIASIIPKLKKEGISILLSEQNLQMALGVSDYVYILSNGEVVYYSTPAALSGNKRVQTEYLAV